MGRKRTRHKSGPYSATAHPTEAVDEGGSLSEPEWRAGGWLPSKKELEQLAEGTVNETSQPGGQGKLDELTEGSTNEITQPGNQEKKKLEELPEGTCTTNETMKPVSQRKRKLTASSISDVGCDEQSKSDADTNQAQSDASNGCSLRRSSRKRTPSKQALVSQSPVSKRPRARTNKNTKTKSVVTAPADVKACAETVKDTKIESNTLERKSETNILEDNKTESITLETKADSRTTEDGVVTSEANFSALRNPEPVTPNVKSDAKITETESMSDNSNAKIPEVDSKSGNSSAKVSGTESSNSKSNANILETESKSNNSIANIPETESQTDSSNVKIPETEPQTDKSNTKIPETDSEKDRSSAKISRAKPKRRKTSAKVVERESKSGTVNSKKPQANDKVTRNKKGRKKGQQSGRRRKQAKNKGRTALPSFDDDEDDIFEDSKSEQERGADTKDIPSLEDSTVTTQRMSFSQEVDMNGLMMEHNEPDLESDASSDEDLPDVLSQESNKVNEDDIVWAKTRGFPFWPAVVKKLYKARGKAAVFFAGERNKSNQKGKGVGMKALKPYSCPEKETYIEAGLKHPKTTKEEFQEALDLAENYITKRGLGKAQGVSFFTTKDYSNVSPSETTPSKCDFSLPYTPSMKPGPLDPPSSPLTPPCDSPLKSIMDSPVWKSGGSLRVNQDQSMDEDGENSDVDEETMEKRKMLTKLQDRLLRYIKKWPVVKDHLFKIYKGETKSLRHKLYCSAKSEDQSKLKLLRGFGPITDDDKQDELILFLSKLFEKRCLQSNEDNNIVMTSYLTDVWFPEVIIFALQKTRRIGHKRAEELFVSEEKNAMEITPGALDIHLPSYLTEEEKRELLENVPKRAARQLGFSPKELGLS